MAQSQGSTERIKVACHCGTTLMAPKRAVGKRVKCPKCKKVLTVPDPGSSVDRMIYALRDEEYNRPPLEEQPSANEPEVTEKGTKLCPSCSAEMRPDAVFCVKCGFHLTQGGHAAATAGKGSGSVGQFLTRLFKRKR